MNALSKDHVNYLRTKFSAHTSLNGHLKTIGLIGAVPSYLFPGSLWEADEALLDRALETLKELGLTVSSDFDPTIVNINEEYGGLDYMKGEDGLQFDVSVFCYIKRITHEAGRTKNPNNKYIKNSPLETRDRHSWLKAAMRRASTVLVTHGTPGLEVSARDFKGGWFLNKSPYKLIHSEPMAFHRMDISPNAQLQVMTHKGMQ